MVTRILFSVQGACRILLNQDLVERCGRRNRVCKRDKTHEVSTKKTKSVGVFVFLRRMTFGKWHKLVLRGWIKGRDWSVTGKEVK